MFSILFILYLVIQILAQNIVPSVLKRIPLKTIEYLPQPEVTSTQSFGDKIEALVRKNKAYSTRGSTNLATVYNQVYKKLDDIFKRGTSIKFYHNRSPVLVFIRDFHVHFMGKARISDISNCMRHSTCPVKSLELDVSWYTGDDYFPYEKEVRDWVYLTSKETGLWSSRASVQKILKVVPGPVRTYLWFDPIVVTLNITTSDNFEIHNPISMSITFPLLTPSGYLDGIYGLHDSCSREQDPLLEEETWVADYMEFYCKTKNNNQ